MWLDKGEKEKGEEEGKREEKGEKGYSDKCLTGARYAKVNNSLPKR